MNFTLRIFLAYFVLVAAGLLLFLYNTYDELRPIVRQTSEETLVDTANMLAEFATPLLVPSAGNPADFKEAVEAYRQRRFQAQIWSHLKTQPRLTLYVTDEAGQVVYSTNHQLIGQDYSQWRDVHATLEGRYGARTTATQEGGPSTMYVAAPVRYEGKLVGVLTVGLPTRSLKPWLNHAQGQMIKSGLLILLLALVLGGILAYWLTRSVHQLVDYVEAARDGKKVQPPQLRAPEFARLAASTEQMRREVEGKQYVEQYVQHLTHEMKSPLSAVRAATEILQDAPLDDAQRAKFLGNIDQESARIQRLIDRLLALATLENRHELDIETLDLNALLDDVINQKTSIAEQRQIHLQKSTRQNTPIQGEHFLLQQAISNLLDNALDFCPFNGQIRCAIHSQNHQATITIENDGNPIPDYALPRLFERFYSLNRPDTGRKSTGLGLSFVQQIAELHRGGIKLENVEQGVRATLVVTRG